MSPVSLVTIHHEGAGAPTDVPRGADGGYSYWIGTTKWTRLRAPKDNWATLGFNHQDLTICLSGNRMEYPVTDAEIDLIHGAFLDCLHRDEVVDFPLVRAHRNSPGSSTVCPGDYTIARWRDVVAACRPTGSKPPPPPEVKVEPDFKPPLVLVSEYTSLEKGKEGAWGLTADGGVRTFYGAYHGSMVNDPHWQGRTAVKIVKAGQPVLGANPPLKSYPSSSVYEVIASDGARYLPVPPT